MVSKHAQLAFALFIVSLLSVCQAIPFVQQQTDLPLSGQVASAATSVIITVKSVDLAGNPITGMWAVIRTPSGTTLASGYTPVNFTEASGVQYVVHVGNYQNKVFSHWGDGTTSSYYTITPTQNVVLTAYYSLGAVAPQPPTGLTAKTFSTYLANLGWVAPTNNGGSPITGYKIERSGNGGSTWVAVVANTGSGSSTTFTDTGLSAGTTYTYRVSAINAVGTSSPSATASVTTSAKETPTGVIIPLYIYPTDGTSWDTVYQAKSAHPTVPIIAIINPNNGPGSNRDSNFVAGIQKLQSAGVTVLGYVYTKYGTRNASSVETDIGMYKNWYAVNGIAFDEMANNGTTYTATSYYSNLTSYAKSLGMTMTVGNPGADTLPGYIGTVDDITIYEDSGLPSISYLGGWHTGYPKADFSFVAFGVNSINATYISTASFYVGYMYITNGVLPDVYTTIPPYLTTLVADLDTATPPQAPTGLIATASSSTPIISLSWIAPTNNSGSPITGYKIERSTDSGNTWSTRVSNTNTTSTTYNDTGLSLGTTYTYRVSAISIVGTSAPSSTASATVPIGTPGGSVTITIKSFDLSQNPITGMYTVLRTAGGTTLASGFTTVTFTCTSGTSYVVHVGNYQTHVFSHWGDGTTSSYYTITPTQNVVLTAYYTS